jgi:hypothetical protein
MATGTIFRRTALDPATLPEVGPAYDLFLAYALARTGGGACYVPERLTAWRVHPSQLTNEGPADWSHGNLLCWCTAAKDPLFAAYRREIADKIATAAVTLAKRCLGQGDGAGARSYAKLALRQQPANWRALAAFGLSLAPRRLARWLVDRRGHYGQ